jgi:hypothetical protein
MKAVGQLLDKICYLFLSRLKKIPKELTSALLCARPRPYKTPEICHQVILLSGPAQMPFQGLHGETHSIQTECPW